MQLWLKPIPYVPLATRCGAAWEGVLLVRSMKRYSGLLAVADDDDIAFPAVCTNQGQSNLRQF